MGSLHNIPHGVANALLLPTVMEFNAPVCREKYVEIAKAMGAYKEDMTMVEASKAACDAVRALAIEVGIPQHLSEIGIYSKDIDALADQAIADVCTPGNPRKVTRDDIVALYKKLL
jgi:lactaldehyde reductase